MRTFRAVDNESIMKFFKDINIDRDQTDRTEILIPSSHNAASSEIMYLKIKQRLPLIGVDVNFLFEYKIEDHDDVYKKAILINTTIKN